MHELASPTVRVRPFPTNNDKADAGNCSSSSRNNNRQLGTGKMDTRARRCHRQLWSGFYWLALAERTKKSSTTATRLPYRTGEISLADFICSVFTGQSKQMFDGLD